MAGGATEATIEVDAAVDDVLDVIADLGAYPSWANGITSAEVLEEGADGRPVRARFDLTAGPIRDTYVIGYVWEPAAVSWSLEEAKVLTAMDGSYTLTPRGEGCEVAYRLTVDLAMPMLGLLKRKAERAVVDTALKDLKTRVESGVSG